MFSTKVTYTDYNGEPVEETLYFNMSKSELLDLELDYPGGIEGFSNSILDKMDRKELKDFCHDLLKRSYGVKDPAGKKFVKNDKVFEEFKCSLAYDEIFIKLLTDDSFIYDFLTNAFPRSEDKTISKEEFQKRLKEKMETDNA